MWATTRQRQRRPSYSPTTMIRHLLTVFPLALQCLANPLSGQTPLVGYSSHAGFSLDLNEQRLVQLEGKSPVWTTELEKVCYCASSLLQLSHTH
jgi:hypothetical protein